MKELMELYVAEQECPWGERAENMRATAGVLATLAVNVSDEARKQITRDLNKIMRRISI